MNFNKLSIEEKFGQMILLGLDTYDLNAEIIALIKNYKIGGVVLYRNNYTSLETMIDFVNKLKEVNKENKIPLFIAIDQENGRVNRLPKDITKIYSAGSQSKTDNIKIIKAVNDVTTYILASTGINMNFAPNLDINRSEKNKVVGNRSYGFDKDEVIKKAFPFMKMMQENNVIPVIKHFPGHGATNKDSHFVIPKIKDVVSLEKNDMEVYKEAIANGADAIMVGHLKLKGYGLKPASLNKKIIQKCLIEKYNYDGLIMTDDLRMNILQYIYGIKNCMKYSIEAGNNLLMIKYKKGDIKRVYEKVLKMAQNCEIDPEKINRSAKKIVAMKKKYRITNEKLNPKLNLELINNKIKKINNAIDKQLGNII